MTNDVLDHHLQRARPLSADQRPWDDHDGALPALYLGHGAPPLLDDAEWMSQLFTWSTSMPKPRGVLIISAHWESAPLAISAPAANTPLVYDFGGFDERFYRLTYPTPDACALATLVSSLMPDTEPLHQHAQRGLDHGAWVPLMAMYPLGDVPVLQLSIPTHDPARLLALGAQLAPLRQLGVLIIGSGFLTHGLPFLSRANWSGDHTPPGWSLDFDAWAAQALASGDIDELAAFAHRAPGMPYAHPTVEHLMPLFVTLGAASDHAQPVDTTIDGWFMGLSKRSIQVA